jgi:nucleoside-diphosphate-sugar epimerase
MPSSVIILGAKGRFGRAAQRAFLNAGWDVTAFGRNWSTPALNGVTQVSGDAFDADVLTAACAGRDVIVNALNPPYPQWSKALPILTANVIKAARQSGATVMIPGNVYNYGQDMPAILREETPHRPTCRKGNLRETMEANFAAATDLQTIILRAGDFIEAEQTGNWFDGQIANKVAKGSIMYPGPTDVPHAWAYLPDMAEAMVGLANTRKTLPKFDTFGFPGYTLTGDALIKGVERVAGRTLKRRGMPWPILRMVGLLSPLMREVYEMRYLWQTPHGIDGSKLQQTLPEWQATPLDVCLKQVVVL